MINSILRGILAWITQFEGHPSVASLQRAISVKVFLSLFLNTALLVLLINAALPASLSSVHIGGAQVFAGKYSGFSVSWHVAVGASIALTLLINVVSPHLYNLLYVGCYLRCRRLAIHHNAVTQMEVRARLWRVGGVL